MSTSKLGRVDRVLYGVLDWPVVGPFAERALEARGAALNHSERFTEYDVGKPVTLATPMTQIPAGVSVPHNNHLHESSQQTDEQAATASWQRDLGESYMQERANMESHPIDHLRGNAPSAELATPQSTLSDEGKGQPDLFSSRVLSYPPESRGPSGYKPTESAQYQAEQTFYGKYSPTMSQQQRDAGRVATAERQNTQSGLFGTMERQQEREL